MMLGQNKIEKPSFDDGDLLNVHEIFTTIQGEGPWVGTPAVFIRLSGCNLTCDFCDTRFEDFRQQTLDEIISDINKQAKGMVKLVVITGGEPFVQSISQLCDKLLDVGYTVQIETNGTIYRPIDERVEIVCSPKNTLLGYQMLREDLLSRLQAIKFLVSARKLGYTEIQEIGQKRYNIPVYLQPMDERNEYTNQQNLERAMYLAIENNYKLSLQTHKLIGIA